jgi:hypothetical protein
LASFCEHNLTDCTSRIPSNAPPKYVHNKQVDTTDIDSNRGISISYNQLPPSKHSPHTPSLVSSAFCCKILVTSITIIRLHASPTIRPHHPKRSLHPSSSKLYVTSDRLHALPLQYPPSHSPSLSLSSSLPFCWLNHKLRS